MAINALIEKIFAEQISDHFFSGAQALLIDQGKIRYQANAGTIRFDSIISVGGDTKFDLASLTKPLCILPMFAWLDHYRQISLDNPLTCYLPQIRNAPSLRSLLNHSSGFPAHESFFSLFPDIPRYPERKAAMIDHIARIGNTFPNVYSDINYILLGFALEEIFDAGLDAVFSMFLKKFGCQSHFPFFITSPVNPSSVAATSYSDIRKQISHGGVEDENAWFMGGVAGHAGLFASAETVGRYLLFLMSKEWFIPFVHKGIGFDKPAGEHSAYGKKPEEYYRGHLGYTGTAFLIDPVLNKIAVLLTNRTHPTDAKPGAKDRIRAVRQRIFDILTAVTI